MTSSSKWWWSTPGKSSLSSMTPTMVSSFTLLISVVNGHKELPQSVSNQWPHINTPLLPPQRGNFTALLPPLLMCLRHFACVCLREKSMEWGKSIRGLTTEPNGLLPTGQSVQDASFIYLFFRSIHLPLSLYPLHFIAFLSVLQCVSPTEQTG